jgi:hypothetical protein
VGGSNVSLEVGWLFVGQRYMGFVAESGIPRDYW